MPLKKILLKPGVNRENTRYTSENGWYDGDKIRFRQGTPEKIGGWVRQSANTFLGLCRSLWAWVTLGGSPLIGVGTNLKFYLSVGAQYYDITPWETTDALGANPFTTDTATNTGTTTTITVSAATSVYTNGNYVDISGATAVAGVTVSGTYLIQNVNAGLSTYQIVVNGTATSSTTGGGSTVYASYEINTGPEYAVPLTGWGAGLWGSGTWGYGTSSKIGRAHV